MMKTTWPILTILAITLLNSTAYAESKTVTYKISLTIPHSIGQTKALENTSTNPNQMIQTQQVIRDNQHILLRSIVAE